jgi:hypothetical protein
MATITITPGNSFTPTETVTSTKLNDLGSPTASVVASSIDTIDIADNAITPALIANDAITTDAILNANVTFAKLADVIDDDTMATATSNNIATSESIKTYVDNQVVLSESYQSLPIAIPSAGTSESIAHSLSAIPKVFSVTYKCITSEYGYAIGDEVHILQYGTSSIPTVWVNDTDINFRWFGTSLTLLDKNSNSIVSLTASNWKLVFRAYT